MKLEFKREKLRDILGEMQPLFEGHWKELAHFQQKIRLDPDVSRYIASELDGKLHLLTARADGKLVGYYLSMLDRHPHYKNDLMCVSDMFYIEPEYRLGSVGIEMFDALEREMRRLGVKVMMTVLKPSNDISPMLERLGWFEAGYIYSKYIGD